ncbi:MAG: hypothetical protein Q3964_01590 [Carnobacterium sp.]|nr:hypothetical protein [Carnobacterium sp.]
MNIKRKKLMIITFGILTAGFLAACSKSTKPAEVTTALQTTTKESNTMETVLLQSFKSTIK